MNHAAQEIVYNVGAIYASGILGFVLGFLMCALCTMAKRADRAISHMEEVGEKSL